MPDNNFRKFYSISLNSMGTEVIVSAETDQNHQLKAYSKNMKCALIYEGIDLKTYLFDIGISGTVSNIITIPSGLYTGVTIDGTTKF